MIHVSDEKLEFKTLALTIDLLITVHNSFVMF